MGRLGTIKEIFDFVRLGKKIYMFPIVIILIAMIGITFLAQSGIVTFVYPI